MNLRGATNIKTKLMIASRVVFEVILKKPLYLALALLFAALIAIVLQWLFSLPLLMIYFESEVLTIGEKLFVLVEGLANLFIYGDDVVPVSIISTSLMLGLSFALIIYGRRVEKSLPQEIHYKKAGAFALIGAGCASCGGSIIAPLLSGFGSAAAGAIAVFTSGFLLIISVFLAAYSLMTVANQVAFLNAKAKSME